MQVRKDHNPWKHLARTYIGLVGIPLRIHIISQFYNEILP